MEIHTQQVNEILVVALEGELDAYWAEETERELWACLEQGHYRLVLDLSRLTYLSSAGLRVLLRLHQRLVSLDGDLLLAAPQPFVREVLAASGFDRTFSVFEAVDQALATATPEKVPAAEDIWATAEAHVTPIGTFHFRPTLTPSASPSRSLPRCARSGGSGLRLRTGPGPSPAPPLLAGDPLHPPYRGDRGGWGEGKANLRVIGQEDDFLYSRGSLERLTTLDLSDLGYALGVGALGELGPTVLDRLGELVSVPGAVYWLPGDGRQVPDFLIADHSPIRNPISNIQYPKLPVHLLYALTLMGPYQVYGRFTAADQEAGASLDDLTHEIIAWASEQRSRGAEERGGSEAGGWSTPTQAVGLVLRADIAGLWGVGLKRSPRAENAPANGQKISHRENIKDWLHFPTEPAYANHTLLAVGMLGEQGSKGTGEQGSTSAPQHLCTSAHVHGATFRFVPELGGDHGLEDELDRVVQQGELVSVAHLLPNTRLRKALFGLWMIEGEATK